jgi:hypothetical protein
MDNLAKSVVSLVALAVAMFPFWVWLLVREMLHPEGFWQNLFVFGAGAWLLGGLQIFMLILFVWFIVAVWSE